VTRRWHPPSQMVGDARVPQRGPAGTRAPCELGAFNDAYVKAVLTAAVDAYRRMGDRASAVSPASCCGSPRILTPAERAEAPANRRACRATARLDVGRRAGREKVGNARQAFSAGRGAG
jgi:hypothetical protein